MILLRRRVTHTRTRIYIQADTHKHTDAEQRLYLAALVYTEDRAEASSSIRQTSCYKNNIRIIRIRVGSNITITISFVFLAIELPIVVCRSPRHQFAISSFEISPLLFIFFISHSHFGLTYFWKCQNAFELLNYFLCTNTHTTLIWPVSNRLAIGLSRFPISFAHNHYGCCCSWLVKSQSNQRIWFLFCFSTWANIIDLFQHVTINLFR